MIINNKEYIPGMDRSEDGYKNKTHLYEGPFSDLGKPMCKYGWHRSDGEGYSVFRNNISQAGICTLCLKRAEANLPGVDPWPHKTKWI